MLKAKETYDQDLMRFRQKLSQLQNQNIDLINELDYMKKQLSQTNKQVSKLTNSNSKLKTIYDAKEMEFDGFMKQRQKIEDKLRKKVKQCEEEKASLLAKNETQKNHISKLVESIVQAFVVLMLNSFSSFRHYCAIALPFFKQLVCHLYTAYITVLLIVDSDDDVIVTGVNKVKEDPDAVIFVASSKVKRNRKGNTALLLSVPSKGYQIQTVMQFFIQVFGWCCMC